MPSHLRNECKFIIANGKKTNRKRLFVLSRKTGYQDFWINDKHYYYNAAEHAKSGEKMVKLSDILKEKQKKPRALKTKITVRGAEHDTARSNVDTNDGFIP